MRNTMVGSLSECAEVLRRQQRRPRRGAVYFLLWKLVFSGFFVPFSARVLTVLFQSCQSGSRDFFAAAAARISSTPTDRASPVTFSRVWKLEAPCRWDSESISCCFSCWKVQKFKKKKKKNSSNISTQRRWFRFSRSTSSAIFKCNYCTVRFCFILPCLGF